LASAGYPLTCNDAFSSERSKNAHPMRREGNRKLLGACPHTGDATDATTSKTIATIFTISDLLLSLLY